jgi:6,7-dimethyl-8-ribityllumazine synthase
MHVAVAIGRFNEAVTERLLEGCLSALRRAGVEDGAITVAWVPGAFELPFACRLLAGSGRFEAVVALGAVVRGATPHFDYVCSEAARGILEVGLATAVPVSFGVLTCDTLEQALERSDSEAGSNKGADAAMAALEMAVLKRQVGPR